MMTNQQILERAIEKAIAGGWDCFGYATGTVMGGGPLWTTGDDHVALLNSEDGSCHETKSLEQIIYSHPFAQALWSSREEFCPYCGQRRYLRLRHYSYCPYANVIEVPLWVSHLQNMVIAPDPIEYLGQHLGGGDE